MVSRNKFGLVCSFCGKDQHEVKKLVAGPTVYICDGCIDLAYEIVHHKTFPKKPKPNTAIAPQVSFGGQSILGELIDPAMPVDQISVPHQLMCLAWRNFCEVYHVLPVARRNGIVYLVIDPMTPIADVSQWFMAAGWLIHAQAIKPEHELLATIDRLFTEAFPEEEKHESASDEQKLVALSDNTLSDTARSWAAVKQEVVQFFDSDTDVTALEIDKDVLCLVPREVCERHNVIPIQLVGITLVVASSQWNLCLINDLKFLTGLNIRFIKAEAEVVSAELEKRLGPSPKSSFNDGVEHMPGMTEVDNKDS